MPTYTYPASAELSEIEQIKLPRMMAERPIFGILPIVNLNSDVIMWEQKDNWTGLQQLRGLNGEPPKVNHVGAKRYVEIPGVYGEFELLDEMQLTNRRALATFGTPANIDDMVTDSQDHLLERRLDRIEMIGWTLLTTGTFSVSYANGAIGHTGTYTLQTYAGSAWGTPGTGTPLLDFRAVALLGRGKGVSFGKGSIAYLNQVTWNKLIANTNAADLGGQNTTSLSNVISLDQVNAILLAQGMPRIEIYDEGYLNDAGTFVPYIADNKTVIIGKRQSGARIGFYGMTRNATNPSGASGPYTMTVNNERPPVSVEVHDGHNGGPALEFPSALVVMTTT